MEEGEKKPDAGTIPGGPQKKIVYTVLAVAIVILAVVLIAKFGYNTDLLNPAGGQMSLVQRNISYKVTTPQFTKVPTYKLELCPQGTTGCSGTCVDLNSDNGNCGSCGNACPSGKICTYGKCCVSPVGDPKNCGGVSCYVDRYNIYAPCGEENCEAVCLEINPWDADCSLTTGAQHVNIYSDVYNCGGCGFKCAAGQTCDRFKCNP